MFIPDMSTLRASSINNDTSLHLLHWYSADQIWTNNIVANLLERLFRTRAARMVDVIGFEPIHMIQLVLGGRCVSYLPGIRVNSFLSCLRTIIKKIIRLENLIYVILS